MKLINILILNIRSFFGSKNKVALDFNHNLLLFGLILSHKPKRILEIGIGSGMVTRSILDAIKYNKSGELTCVDNWFDTMGIEPSFVKSLNKKGAKIIAPVSEEDFTTNYDGELFDFIVSDGDHFNSGNWVDKTFLLLSKNGFILFHDTNQHDIFPNLSKILKHVSDNNYYHYHFTKKSLNNERSDRGFLMVIKDH